MGRPRLILRGIPWPTNWLLHPWIAYTCAQAEVLLLTTRLQIERIIAGRKWWLLKVYELNGRDQQISLLNAYYFIKIIAYLLNLVLLFT